MVAQSKEQRDMRLDFMRALGTLTIIVPHVLSPDILVQIRAFDVVMLVFVSGMSYAYQNINGHSLEYHQYVKKRCKKLLFPTMILIFIVFGTVNMVSIMLSKGVHYDLCDLLKSIFLFEDGIGYVWIIKVYLGLALLAPLIWKFFRKVNGNAIFLGICVVTYIASRIIREITQKIYIPLINVLFEEYVFYIVAYSIPFSIGIYIGKNKKEIKGIGIWFILLFICAQIAIVVRGRGFEPNAYKYPPQLYYLAYGTVCSIVIYYIAPTKINTCIRWLSQNSLVFYLVHVFWIIWISTIINSLNLQIINVFWLKYILVVLLTTLTTLGINKCLALIKGKTIRK